MGQYGGIIGGVAGAVIGSFVPGLGTAAGWALGSALGGAYSASQQVIPGPKIGEIQMQTAQEGGPRPIVFGRSHPIAGNVIADGKPRIVRRRERQGKGGPKVESESVYRTYALAFCEGPITAFLQVWRNNVLVYDAEDPSMAAENAAFLKYARFYLGSWDQMPSPDLEAVLGAGNVHAHRGTAYMVLADEDCTDQRGMWSQWKVRVARFPDVEAGMWWAVRMPETSGSRPLWRAETPLGFDQSEQRGQPGIELSSGTTTTTFVRAGNGNFIIYASAPQIEVYSTISDPLPAPAVVTITGRDVAIRRIGSYGGVLVALINGRGYYYTSLDGGYTWVEHVAPLISDDLPFIADIARLANGTWVSHFRLGPEAWFGYSTAELPVGWSAAAADPVSLSGVWSAIAVLGNQAFAVSNGYVYETTGGLSWTADLVGVDVNFGSIAATSQNVVVFADTNSNNIARYANGSWSNIAIGRSSRAIHYGNGYFVLSGDSSTGEITVSTDGFTTFSRVSMPSPNPLWAVGYTESAHDYRQNMYPLSLLVQELCDRANAGDKIDVSDLAGIQVRGLTVTNQYPCFASLQSLSQAFFFNPANVGGRVKFVRLGGDAIVLVSEDEMIDDDADIESDSRRGDSIGVPRVLHLNYYDVQGGLNTDKQHSERPEGTRAEGEASLQTAVVLSHSEAATVVAKTHAMMAEAQKGELHIPLPDNYLFLTESDPIHVQYEGKTVRGIISEAVVMDGEQRYRVLRDRQSIYTINVEGIPPAPVTRPPSSIVGPTQIEVLDIPILRDADDALGLYLAISGIMPAWQGAFVELSMDGGETYTEGQTVRADTIMGALTTPLGDHPQAFPDAASTCTVAISTPNALLEGTTLAGMLNRRNLALIGSEIVNFADVDEIEPGVWGLSQFLRGRKGTAPDDHAAGERFVLLSGAIFVPAELVMLDRQLTVRATSLGADSESATVTTIMFAGQSQRERAPAYLQARRDGGTVVASWQGVGRLGGGVHVAMGQHFAGYRVTLTDGATTQTHDTVAPTFAASLSAFAGPVTVRVQQRNTFTGPGPSIEVTI